MDITFVFMLSFAHSLLRDYTVLKSAQDYNYSWCGPQLNECIAAF